MRIVSSATGPAWVESTSGNSIWTSFTVRQRCPAPSRKEPPDETARALCPGLRPLRLDHAWHGARAASGDGQPRRDFGAAEVRARPDLRPTARLRLSPATGPVPILDRGRATAGLDGDGRTDQCYPFPDVGVASVRPLVA